MLEIVINNIGKGQLVGTEDKARGQDATWGWHLRAALGVAELQLNSVLRSPTFRSRRSRVGRGERSS